MSCERLRFLKCRSSYFNAMYCCPTIMYSYSSLCENYRFLSDKYDIWPINWTKSFSIVLRKFYDYVDKHVYSANEAILIRDLCIQLDSGDFSFFNVDELNEVVVLLCTA